ncbi:hypothetical protein ACFFX1_17720 [Dactylosporangium sucinum]|uniref:NHL repeat containing protein n=1 Tax=Dactylosporangium sucinum TaxID=1424081 RepID=A0A917TVZ6_9ACTN|nr:hypothetical protein [Dactylosporangium sucinum]GGM40291.1 hypothetical protein GCM10007977_047070 [Dactylosporangium sucinum]
MKFALKAGVCAAATALAVGAFAPSASAHSTDEWRFWKPFINQFKKVDVIASTVPANGDVNPYGVAVVPRSKDKLRKGEVLVSNFNNSDNHQGTGTTIVQISREGKVSLFAQIDAKKLPGACPGGVGLTTALVVLRTGWVIVGSLPTADGTSATAQAGCLIVLDSKGQVRETFSGHGINGPWDMTADDKGESVNLFVTNVLNGIVGGQPATTKQGTVLRLELKIKGDRPPVLRKITTIGSGFTEKTDPTALIIGPTGVGLGKDGTLYVADTVASRIAAIPDADDRRTSAGTGRTITQGGRLSGPLGLAIAPNGNVLTVNGGDGNIVETNPRLRMQVAFRTLVENGAGALFGVAIAPDNRGVYFVNDNDNTLELLH